MKSIDFSPGLIVVEGALITLSETGKGFSLDRIEVQPHQRGMGVMGRAIAAITAQARLKGVPLSVAIMADNHDDHVEEKMVKVFMDAGFTPLELDGEVYRKELYFDPPKYMVHKPPLKNEIALLLQKIAQLPCADQIRVFGSAATMVKSPTDLDVVFNVEPTSDRLLTAKQEQTISTLLVLAKKYYGLLDPFINKGNELWVRNDYATEYQQARNKKGILNVIERQSKSVQEVMLSYGVEVILEKCVKDCAEPTPGMM